MVPADQGLEPIDLPARQMDHRLVVEDELLVVDGSLQVRLQLQPPQRRVVHLGFEDLIAVLPRFLRDVHRDVGVAEELLRSLRTDRPVRTRARDPDARPDEDLLPVELERSVQRLEDPNGDVGRTDALATVLEQDRELVATEPGRRVRRAEARPQPLPHLAQQTVAGRVSERVVDRLEVVEVHEQDRHRQVGARQALQRVLDAVAEERAVREPGDRVVEGLVRQLLLERLALRDVPGVQDDPLHVGIVHQVRAEGLDVEPEVVSVPHPRLDQRGRDPSLAARGGQELEHRRLVVGVDQTRELRPLELRGVIAEHTLHRRAHVADGRIGVDHHHDVGRVLDERPEPRLASAGGGGPR